MLNYLSYAIRTIFRWTSNLVRKLGKGPEYILFTLGGDYPMLPKPGGNPLWRLFRPAKTSLWELCEQLRWIAADHRVKGVVFVLRPLLLPLAKIDELRQAFTDLRSAGKRVVVWSYTYDTTSYYLATAADQILLLPGGLLAPIGLYRSYTYLADALAWVGIQADFIQVSPYKSAMDSWTRREMSEQVREMGNWLADSTYQELLAAVAEGREVDLKEARAILDQTPCTDLEAQEIGAVDALLGEEEIPSFLGEAGKAVNLEPWSSARRRLIRQPLKKPGRYLALMTIEGMILDGRSSEPPVEPPLPLPVVMEPRAGDISVVHTARQIMMDRRVAGVVLYVDSRGGSSTASESMRIALDKLAAMKPLVVVMGQVGASGGYWVSTPGKTILAQPNTITGSIGVLAGKIAQVGLLEKLMVHQETIRRGEHIGIFQPEAPFSPQERERMNTYIQRVYAMFLERVADSREIPLEEVEAIAGGRVYTGRQALENGLVDDMGGLAQAFAKARDLAGLDERAPVRFFTPGKGILPPAPQPAALWRYALDNLAAAQGRALCILPWVETNQ